MWKKAIFSHLCTTYSTFHPISISPFLSLPPLSVCLLSLPFPFVLCMLRLIVWTRNALMAFSQRAQISAALEENGAWWRWGVEIFQTQLSHAAITHPHLLLPFSFFIHTAFLSSLHATVVTSVVVGSEALGWGETVDRASILSGENALVWQSKASIGREWPTSLLHFGQNSLVVKTHQTGQTGTEARTCSYMEGEGKKTTKKFLSFSVFLKNWWKNLPVEAR